MKTDRTPRMSAKEYRERYGMPQPQPFDLTPPAAPAPKRKYRNQPITVDGERFDSKGEAEAWQALQMRVRAGEIANLRRQVPFEFVVHGVVVGRARFDFAWIENHRQCVADFKGYMRADLPATKLYKIKCNLMRACFRIEVQTLTKPKRKKGKSL